MNATMSSELFRIVLEAAWDTSADVMLVVNEGGRIIACNDQSLPLLGWKSAHLVGQTLDVLIPPHRRKTHAESVSEYLEDPKPRRMGKGAVLSAWTRKGEEVPVDISLSSVQHQGVLYTLATIRDASEQMRFEKEMLQLGFRDSLTGLYNRHYLDEELVRVAQGREWPIGIVMADIDGLKRVNDEEGHHAGDALITGAAGALRASVRAHDVVARIGGDEFAAVLTGVSEQELVDVATRIEAACNDDESGVKMSTGWAVGQQGDSLRAVMREADARMYEAKRERKRRQSATAGNE